MLFFQVLLFCGYLYAHMLIRWCTPYWQGLIHVALLCAAMLTLPIEPDATWKPTGAEHPTWYLLKLLLVHVGAPYFMLSSTGPLLQAWLGDQGHGNRVYRLYALSNVGSLLALLSYPVLIEPWLPLSMQTRGWSVAFCLFAAIQGFVATWQMRASRQQPDQAGSQAAVDAFPPAIWQQAAWLGLPAFASLMLLAVTNHVSQEIAVIPFLWVVPLSLYLLTFIICFDRPQWYRRKVWALISGICLLTLPLTSHGPLSASLIAQASSYLSLLFGICMLCHGEVAALKPSPRYLTQYYVLLSLGGAIGGLFVGIVCPLVFTSYFEMPMALAISAGLVMTLFVGSPDWHSQAFDIGRAKQLAGVGAAAAILLLVVRGASGTSEVLTSERNFYGVLKVVSFGDQRGMLHGRTVHGLQLPAPRQHTPTTYYANHSGIGRTFQALQQRHEALHVGAIGLGCGTLAVYGRPTDHIDFVEINPGVVALAREHFGFLKDSQAAIDVHVGDGRLVIERMPKHRYDLLVLDAFSSDAVPAHLLTLEAIRMYADRVRPGGTIAFHVTNLHLDLAPVVHRLAKEIGWQSREIRSAADAHVGAIDAHWVVLTQDASLWEAPTLSVAKAPLSMSFKRLRYGPINSMTC